MSGTERNYLRTHRMRAGLSQTEVAFLFGLSNGKTMSRCERMERSMTAEEILALQIIFDVPIQEVFPGLHLKVEKLAIKRIQMLIKKLERGTESRAKKHKREILIRMRKRIGCI